MADTAREELVLAQRRLGRCSGGSTPNTRQLLPAPTRNMGRRLQEAYTHLWKLQLSQGWSKLKVPCFSSVSPNLPASFSFFVGPPIPAAAPSVCLSCLTAAAIPMWRLLGSPIACCLQHSSFN